MTMLSSPVRSSLSELQLRHRDTCCLNERKKLASSKGRTIPTTAASPCAISSKKDTNISLKKPTSLPLPSRTTKAKTKTQIASFNTNISSTTEQEKDDRQREETAKLDNKTAYLDRAEDDDLTTPTNDNSNRNCNISLVTAAALRAAISSSSSSSFKKCEELIRKSQLNEIEITRKASGKAFPYSKSINSLKDVAPTVCKEDKSSLTDINCGPSGRTTTTSSSIADSNKCGSFGTATQEEEQQDEVEIVSLLEEEIPRYKLRADTITKFTGYPNEDFVGIPYPALSDYSPVTPEQAYLTLGYFLLSGERVSQMTKTYADADALQRLLEEKEKDLELAARIGQQLLEENHVLREKVNAFGNESRESQETITQLKHELLFKSQLLELYKDDNCIPSEETSKATTPISSISTLLDRRLALLEEENQFLRTETCKLAENVEKCEAEEKCLVDDAIKKLSDSNSRATKLSDDLEKKCEESASQQEEIIYLTEEVKTLKEINKEIFDDNIQLHKIVEDLKVTQNNLTVEFLDLKDNYIEVVAILKETQEQLREAQKQRDAGADAISIFDSLAYELESSVARQRRSSDYFRRCFDTVRCVSQTSSKHQLHRSNDSSLLSNSSQLLNSSGSSGYHSNCSGLQSLEESSSNEIVTISSANALVSTSSSAMSFVNSNGSSCNSISLCLSPSDSVCTPSDKFGWRLPERLQIVKPLEGSSTLQVWSNLATPHLGNLLEKRPGVHSRVERPLNEIKMLSLTEGSQTLQPNFVSAPTVFTFTTTNSSSTISNIGQDITATVYSSLSMTNSSSHHSSPLPSTSVSSNTGNEYTDVRLISGPRSGDYLKCETPQNSPDEGNSRAASPTLLKQDTHNRTFQTLYSVYDSLVGKLGGLGGNSQCFKSSGYEKPKRSYNLVEKIDLDIVFNEKSRTQAPPRPGSGVMDKIMRLLSNV